MSLLDRKTNALYGKEPIESNYSHITKAQLDYIEILSTRLNLSRASRNAHILSITKRSFDNDIYLLSKSEASQVIAKMKEWLEARDKES